MPTASPSRLSRSGAAGQGPQLRTLLLCDLVESTALIERLGDFRAAALLRRHDQVVRRLLPKFAGREIDKSDGFLLLFEHPIQAVGFALAYQRALRELRQAEQEALSARVGIHVGKVMLRNAPADEVALGAKPVDVEGLAKPVAARLMQLARPGQVLLSAVAYVLAQRTRDDLPFGGATVHWCTHGRYRFKGVPLPMLVHEVGEPGIAPLRAPASGAKARRDVPPWRRPGALVLEAVALLALAVVGAWLLFGPPAAIAFRERDWVVMGSLDNRTGDVRFDASLETALRIGLEQSHHLNVLPELKARDTLQRMNRSPDTAIDRALGSEIALRDGARALVLPSVAEVGGRLRISIEVVDPHSRGTVYAESADGIGIESALASVEEVSDRLRQRLGEATGAIEQASEPLERTTSSNLDALRAYSLGQRAHAAGRLADAETFFGQALGLDPDFAMARLGMARIRYTRGEFGEFREQIGQAMRVRNRLSAREALALDAMRATAERSPGFAEQWKALAELYPDHHPALHNYGTFLWEQGRFAEAEGYFRRASVLQSLTRPVSTYMLGVMLLGQNRLEEATKAFNNARALGQIGGVGMEAASLAARNRFDQALGILFAREPASPRDAAEREILAVAIALDKGDRSLADAHRQRLVAAGAALPPEGSIAWAAKAAHLAWSSKTQPSSAVGEEAAGIVGALSSRISGESGDDLDIMANALLYAGWVAAGHARPELAAVALEASAGAVAASPMRRLGQLASAVAARRDLALGLPDQAIDRLGRVNESLSPLLVHATLAEALEAAGRPDEAAAKRAWLAANRGRAYAESVPASVLQIENVSLARQARLASSAAAHIENNEISAVGKL